MTTYSIREEEGLHGIYFDEFFRITYEGKRLEVVSAYYDGGLGGRVVVYARRERKNGNGFTTQAYVYSFWMKRLTECGAEIGFPAEFVAVAEKCHADS